MRDDLGRREWNIEEVVVIEKGKQGQEEGKERGRGVGNEKGERNGAVKMNHAHCMGNYSRYATVSELRRYCDA